MEQLIQRLKAIKQQILELHQDKKMIEEALSKKDKEVNRLKKLIEIQNSTIKDLENKLKMKRIADEINGNDSEENGSNRDLKFKINEMIKEVDRIISLMHQ